MSAKKKTASVPPSASKKNADVSNDVTPEKEANFLEVLRGSHFSFEKLPDAITLPERLGNNSHEQKPLLLATVDDIAFAQQALDRALSRTVAEIEALRHLHDHARSLGAKGADYALTFIRNHGGMLQ